MHVVFDANVIVAAVGWNGEGFRCLRAMARRRCFAVGTAATIEETREQCERIIADEDFQHNAAARLDFYLERVRLVEPMPLGKRRSRDPKDDPYLAAALAVPGAVVVTYDRDLLALERPFGVHILRPGPFLAALV